ncbi:hypothetical protein HanPSC8_Chr11g0501631 [Helianthus annuus]|nr:hypothetical protein HanPSC8_Chr11g0501631 [Helianthus annuus]
MLKTISPKIIYTQYKLQTYTHKYQKFKTWITRTIGTLIFTNVVEFSMQSNYIIKLLLHQNKDKTKKKKKKNRCYGWFC